MTIFPLISSLLLVAAILLLLALTPERITEDLLKIISPKQMLRDKVKIAQGRKRGRKISAELSHIHDALTATGKGGQFTVICALSLTLFIFGGVLALLIGNVFLVPALAIALALIPFIYAKTTIGYYDRHIEDEIETALSIITTSYNRSDDIVSAVRENISCLKPPVNGIFRSFLGDATAVSSDTKGALRKLKGRIGNPIFKEWCDTLIQCQDDRTLKSSLLPVVKKLSDVRIVNNELKTMLYEPRKEYFLMVALVVANVPLLYMLNRSWYSTLMHSLAGKIVLALCGVVVLTTALLMMKYTRPIEYRR